MRASEEIQTILRLTNPNKCLNLQSIDLRLLNTQIYICNMNNLLDASEAGTSIAHKRFIMEPMRYYTMRHYTYLYLAFKKSHQGHGKKSHDESQNVQNGVDNSEK